MTPKRYRDRDSILKDIDASVRKANRLKSKVDQLLGDIELLDPEFHFVQIKNLNEEIDDLEAARTRILTTRLKRLQNTLAVFDTPTFDGTARDVCLQRV